MADSHLKKGTPTIPWLRQLLPKICERIRKNSKEPNQTNRKSRMGLDSSPTGSIRRITKRNSFGTSTNNTQATTTIPDGNGCLGFRSCCDTFAIRRRQYLEAGS